LSDGAQLLTLAGVALGALCSYASGAVNERLKFKREIGRQWSERRFECFAAYAAEVKTMSTLARRMAAARGLHTLAPDALSVEAGAPLLTEAEVRRSISMESLRLLADADTVAAAHRLNEAVWRLEWIAKGTVPDGTPSRWDQAMSRYLSAFDDFHRAARRELGVPGTDVPRIPGPVPHGQAPASLGEERDGSG
jgi:hypothetical protein